MRARLAALTATISLLFGSACVRGARPVEDSPRLNVIVIVTDDQSFDSIPRAGPVMPFLQRWTEDPSGGWTVFSNAFVNTPLCCPSRTTMLTGRYPHHTGVSDNADGALLDEGSTLAVWLHDAGYHTGLVGKYLNGYPFGRGPYVPPGWDGWWGKEQGTEASLYHDFTLVEEGRAVRYGSGEADYSTDVFASKALGFLRESPSDRPFFLWFAPTAPHPPWVSAPREEGAYADLEVDAAPSVGEPDVSDKPAWVRALPLPTDAVAASRTARRASYEALLAVDDAVRGMVDVLRDHGELDETVIFYLSDNGLSFGEHRWTAKKCEYDECIRVPFLVRLPGTEHRIDPTMVSAVDVAATIAGLAGVRPTTPQDGVSLVPLLRTGSSDGLPGEVFGEWAGDEEVPGWWELRRPGWAYVELATGERELYDLREDPFELSNLAGDPTLADRVLRLSAVLAGFRGS
jgi:N-acetylglucosamine-6-sulfatase